MHTVKWVNELVARMNHGIFITFEGVEGSGKTTQVEVLADRLQQAGYPVITTREPGGTPISDRIRAVVLDQSRVEIHPHTEALLMCAARAQLVNELIRPSLERGHVVICDRYSDSTFAYQGFARGQDLDDAAHAQPLRYRRPRAAPHDSPRSARGGRSGAALWPRQLSRDNQPHGPPRLGLPSKGRRRIPFSR